jgi:hypothetical protein
MDKQSARRLRPGDEVFFGPHRRVQDCEWFLWGDVLYVSPAGGIKVVTELGDERWLPYSNVVEWRRLSEQEKLEKLYRVPWDGPF